MCSLALNSVCYVNYAPEAIWEFDLNLTTQGRFIISRWRCAITRLSGIAQIQKPIWILLASHASMLVIMWSYTLKPFSNPSWRSVSADKGVWFWNSHYSFPVFVNFEDSQWKVRWGSSTCPHLFWSVRATRADSNLIISRTGDYWVRHGRRTRYVRISYSLYHLLTTPIPAQQRQRGILTFYLFPLNWLTTFQLRGYTVRHSLSRLNMSPCSSSRSYACSFSGITRIAHFEIVSGSRKEERKDVLCTLALSWFLSLRYAVVAMMVVVGRNPKNEQLRSVWWLCSS